MPSGPTAEVLAERLRAAGLRPTAVRIGVLEVMQASGASFASAAEICVRMIERGSGASGGTLYRAIHELEAHGFLLRITDCARRTRYRLHIHADPPGTLQIVCHGSGRTVTIAEPALADHLASALRQVGFDPAGHTMTIYLDPDRLSPG
ncbi:transcriptional repressor [Variovorax sp. J22P168]|uniref:Fur family transcriptional regulator n=1 Tax=Variovorax jilinensis TaxID=3053513 RepID=UPI0025790A95|nr:transcriptional repressor [Variovorax sp. J22P168]MDM0014722.1 transcriptional repressor [Variovorax sp. J22P168]